MENKKYLYDYKIADYNWKRLYANRVYEIIAETENELCVKDVDGILNIINKHNIFETLRDLQIYCFKKKMQMIYATNETYFLLLEAVGETIEIDDSNSYGLDMDTISNILKECINIHTENKNRYIENSNKCLRNAEDSLKRCSIVKEDMGNLFDTNSNLSSDDFSKKLENIIDSILNL